VKHQQHAEQKQRAQVKRKYIASSSAPSAAFKAQLEATGGIVAVSSLAKNKLDFSGAKAAANGAPKHTRFDDNGNPAAAGQAAAAAAAAAAPAASNKSAAQLLREKLKGAGSSQPPEQQQQAAAKEETQEPQQQQQQSGESGQDSGPLPGPLTKRAKVDGSQDTDGDKLMSEAVSPSSAAAAAAADADGVSAMQESQEVKQEGDGAMEDIAALPEDEVGRDRKLIFRAACALLFSAYRIHNGAAELVRCSLDCRMCCSTLQAWVFPLMLPPLMLLGTDIVSATLHVHAQQRKVA
jgi:hypothetical protein